MPDQAPVLCGIRPTRGASWDEPGRWPRTRLLHSSSSIGAAPCIGIREVVWSGGRLVEGGQLQDVGQVELDRLLQLLVGTGVRVTVRTPPVELRGVPEPHALHVLV